MKRLKVQFSELAIEELSAIQDQLWTDRLGRDLFLLNSLKVSLIGFVCFLRAGKHCQSRGPKFVLCHFGDT